jgi:ribonuclease J
MSEPLLKFISLGGIDAVTQNMYVYEAEGQILIVDCGIGFPEEARWGVDVVIPDVTYLIQRRDRIRGILVTHGHEDHFGALPYLLPKLGYPPIWSTKLVAGLIENKLREAKKIRKATIKVLDPKSDETCQLGVFKVAPFLTNHSVPDSLGYAIDTPAGRVFHIADFKFDWQSVSGQRFDVAKLARLAGEDNFLLASDCLGVNHPGYTRSEKEIEPALDRIVGATRGRVFFTTISSNISRMQQAINVARAHRRSIVILGRSIDTTLKIAQKLGYIDLEDREIIKPPRAQNMPPERLLYLIAGSYGQTDSALARLARRNHSLAEVGRNDVVVFSADPAPPGTRAQVDVMVDNLFKLGADVHYYDTQENLYVSGHASRGDISLLINLVKPRFLIPIGGTPRHLYAYADLVEEMAIGGKVLILSTGEVLEISPDSARVKERIPVKQVFVDGSGVGDVDLSVLGERQRLGTGGLVVVVIPIDARNGKVAGRLRLEMRGLTTVKEKDFARRVLDAAEAIVDRRGGGAQGEKVSRDIEAQLGELFKRQFGRSPLIMPIFLSV